MTETMQRIAWFTPLAPGANGPPFGNLELIAGIGRHHAVDVFTDAAPASASDGSSNAFAAHDFVWKNVLQPYDLTVYEIADTARHGFVWPYLVRYPGLVVLHDDRLHRLRSRMMRRTRRQAEYRAEFSYCYPEATPEVPELGFAGLLGAAADIWPMRQIVLACSRLVVIGDAWRAGTLRLEASHDRFRVVRPGVSKPSVTTDERAALRAEAGIEDNAFVLASFGRIGPQRRIQPILEAVSVLNANLHVLACGQVESGYDPEHDANALGLSNRFTLVPDADERQWLRYRAVADVALCLDWPDGCEAIRPWLTCLAFGLPTIVTDRANRVDIPTLDPRSWQVQYAQGPGEHEAGGTPAPAAVSIDIIDELHSLRIAIRRLSKDVGLRAQLAEAGTALWRERFGFDQMVEGYLEAIQEAQTTPTTDARPSDLPAHLLDDRTTHVRSLLGSLGVKYALET